MRWSYSTLQIPCPRAFLKKWRGDKVEVTPARADITDEGILVHSLVEQALKNEAEWDSAWEQIEKILGPRARDAEHHIKLLIANREIHAEKWFELAGYDDQPLVGKIDIVAIDGETAYLVDIKTTFQIPQTFAEQSQMEIYALPWLLDGYTVWTGALYIRGGVLRWAKEPLTFDRDFERIDGRVRRAIEEKKAWLEKGYERPNPSWYCDYCPFRKTCPKLEDPQDIFEMAQEYIKLKAITAAYEKELKAYTAEFGAIELPDGTTIGHYESETVKVKPEAIEWAQEHAPELLRIDTTAFKKALKKDAALEKFVQREVSTRFGIKRNRNK